MYSRREAVGARVEKNGETTLTIKIHIDAHRLGFSFLRQRRISLCFLVKNRTWIFFFGRPDIFFVLVFFYNFPVFILLSSKFPVAFPQNTLLTGEMTRLWDLAVIMDIYADPN